MLKRCCKVLLLLALLTMPLFAQDKEAEEKDKAFRTKNWVGRYHAPTKSYDLTTPPGNRRYTINIFLDGNGRDCRIEAEDNGSTAKTDITLLIIFEKGKVVYKDWVEAGLLRGFTWAVPVRRHSPSLSRFNINELPSAVRRKLAPFWRRAQASRIKHR